MSPATQHDVRLVVKVFVISLLMAIVMAVVLNLDLVPVRLAY